MHSTAQSRSRLVTLSLLLAQVVSLCAHLILFIRFDPSMCSRSHGLQFALASGANVIALSSSDEKLKIVTKLGAQHVINYNTTPEWDEKVLELTGGRGVDHVLEVGVIICMQCRCMRTILVRLVVRRPSQNL